MMNKEWLRNVFKRSLNITNHPIRHPERSEGSPEYYAKTYVWRSLATLGMTCGQLHHRKLLILIGLSMNTGAHTLSSEQYLNKFLTYTHWCQHLPLRVDAEFLAFIEKPTPLTRKLREKWLYQLAYNKDWSNFNQYYPGSSDTTLQCYSLNARFQQGQKAAVLHDIDSLWLNGSSQPKACDTLFNALLKNHDINDTLIKKRIALALNNRNVSLARYLLKQLSPPRQQDADILASIHQDPKRITQLTKGDLHGEFYLYGLTRMVPKQMDKAIGLSNTPLAKTIMNEGQKQTFIAFVALYKAMRNEPDTEQWFAKVKSAWKNETLLEWQIRYALLHHHWPQILRLIEQSQNKFEPGWQYWKARALQALHEPDKAYEIYRQLATKRHYYGFLASLKLKKSPSFDNEPILNNPNRLLPYLSITNQIKTLYLSHQIVDASRLLNDLVSEMPKKDKSALAFWLANDLHWYGKSIYISNTDDLNNQLALRFPLAHRETVKKDSKNYHIPEELIYAVIRQESSFQDNIASPAGANGLMQVLPRTAEQIAKQAHIDYKNKVQLFSPQTNIHIGTAYLQQLAKQFHQHPVLMMAAYNAGPKQTNYWLKNHTPHEIDIWIETLPWRETRNYLKNIIAFYSVYQYRMHQTLSLASFMQPISVKEIN